MMDWRTKSKLLLIQTNQKLQMHECSAGIFTHESIAEDHTVSRVSGIEWETI